MMAKLDNLVKKNGKRPSCGKHPSIVYERKLNSRRSGSPLVRLRLKEPISKSLEMGGVGEKLIVVSTKISSGSLKNLVKT